MITTILTFIIILGILVFVHEFGHFIVARKSGMKVEEFGFGFPPRVIGIQKVRGEWRMRWGHKEIDDSPTTTSPLESPLPNPPHQGEGILQTAAAETLPPLGGVPNEVGGGGNDIHEEDSTIYSINLIPLGGFVRILGENNEAVMDPRSFINRPFWGRFLTLVAGVTMNVLLAWVLISTGYIIGIPAAVESQSDLPRYATLKDQHVAIIDTVPGLPADKAGLKAGDIVLSVDGQAMDTIQQMQDYVKTNAGKTFDVKIKRGGEEKSVRVESNANPPEGQGPTGIGLASLGTLQVPWQYAFWEGLKTTGIQMYNIVHGLYKLITAGVGLSSVGGPVKIAKLTGEVSRMGFIYLLQFTAFLSLNLAVLNIMPFPALDGGRVLFLIIEKLNGKRNNQKFEQYANATGFAILLLLMLLVTIKDILKK